MIPTITVTMSGDVRAVLRVTKVREAVRDNVRNRVATSIDELYDRVRANLSGGVLQSRTGVLLNALEKVFSESPTAVTGQVRIRGVSYAAIQEEGGQTAPHDIFARNAKVLAFIYGSNQVFTPVVHHPGSKIPASGYMARALRDNRASIIASITGGVREAVNNA